MRLFLSEETLRRHSAECARIRLLRQILEKETPALCTVRLFTSDEPGTRAAVSLPRSLRLRNPIREDVYRVLGSIAAHTLYFSSFARTGMRCPALRAGYSSEAGFLYEAKCMAMKTGDAFLFAVPDTRRGACLYTGTFPPPGTVLSLDLCEHAYFLDYGFEREKYIGTALAYWDLSRLSGQKTIADVAESEKEH